MENGQPSTSGEWEFPEEVHFDSVNPVDAEPAAEPEPVEAAPQGEPAPVATTEPEPKAEAPDPLKNLRAEYDRKLGNLQRKFDESALRQEQLLAQLGTTLERLASSSEPKPKQEVADPYAHLNKDDPDYYYQKLEVDLQQSRKATESLQKRLDDWMNGQQQERQTAQKQTEQQQFVQWVSGNVVNAVREAFKDFPQTPEVEAAMSDAYEVVDSEWHRGGYSTDSYAKAYERAQRISARLGHLKAKPAAPAPVAQPRPAPVPVTGRSVPSTPSNTTDDVDPFSEEAVLRSASALRESGFSRR